MHHAQKDTERTEMMTQKQLKDCIINHMNIAVCAGIRLALARYASSFDQHSDERRTCSERKTRSSTSKRGQPSRPAVAAFMLMVLVLQNGIVRC